MSFVHVSYVLVRTTCKTLLTVLRIYQSLRIYSHFDSIHLTQVQVKAIVIANIPFTFVATLSLSVTETRICFSTLHSLLFRSVRFPWSLLTRSHGDKFEFEIWKLKFENLKFENLKLKFHLKFEDVVYSTQSASKALFCLFFNDFLKKWNQKSKFQIQISNSKSNFKFKIKFKFQIQKRNHVDKMYCAHRTRFCLSGPCYRATVDPGPGLHRWHNQHSG